MTVIGSISNGELGSSVRSKLNSVIDKINPYIPTLKQLGAFGDGDSHPASDVYASLDGGNPSTPVAGSLRYDFPTATSLTQEMDAIVIEHALANNMVVSVTEGIYLINYTITQSNKYAVFLGEKGAVLKGYGSPQDAVMIAQTNSSVGWYDIEFDVNHTFRTAHYHTSANGAFDVRCRFLNAGLVATTSTGFSAFVHCTGSPILYRSQDSHYENLIILDESSQTYGTWGGGATGAGGGYFFAAAPSSSGYTDVLLERCKFIAGSSDGRELDMINQNTNAVNGPGMRILGCYFEYNENIRRCGKHHSGIMIFDGGSIVKSADFTAASPVGGDAQSEIGIRTKGAIEAAGSSNYAGTLIVRNMYIDYTGFTGGVTNTGNSTQSSLYLQNSTLKGSNIKYSRYDYETSANQQGYSLGFRDATSSLVGGCSNCIFLGGGTPAQLVGSNGYIENCIIDDPMYYGIWINSTILSNTAQSGSTSSTLVLNAGAQSIDDYYNGKTVVITGGTGSGQRRTITDYTGSTKTATVYPNWSTTPDNTSTFELGGTNMRVSNNTIISRTPTFLTTNTEVFRVQGNKGTDVNVYGNTFTRAGNNSAITRFINPAYDVLGNIRDNMCPDTSIICVNISNTNTQAKIYNNNSTPHVRADTTTAYTVNQSDYQNYRTLSNASPITCTLPNHLPAGFTTTIEQLGVGQITFTAASGATLLNPTGQNKSLSQYSTVVLRVRTNTNGTNAAWVISGGVEPSIRVVTAAGAVTVTNSDTSVVVNKTSGAATVVNLPSAYPIGKRLTIKDGKGDAATNNLTLTPAAGNIDGSASYVMSTNYQSVDLIYNGSEWNIL